MLYKDSYWWLVLIVHRCSISLLFILVFCTSCIWQLLNKRIVWWWWWWWWWWSQLICNKLTQFHDALLVTRVGVTMEVDWLQFANSAAVNHPLVLYCRAMHLQSVAACSHGLRSTRRQVNSEARRHAIRWRFCFLLSWSVLLWVKKLRAVYPVLYC